jgi:hypothetical protein
VPQPCRQISGSPAAATGFLPQPASGCQWQFDIGFVAQPLVDATTGEARRSLRSALAKPAASVTDLERVGHESVAGPERGATLMEWAL